MTKVKQSWLKRCYQWLLRRLKEYYSRRYYTSIKDIPIWNWWQIHETKDFVHMLNCKKKVTSHATLFFDELYSEFISTFGISKSYKEYLEKLKDIRLAEIDMVLNEDYGMETFIDVMKIELEDIKSASSGGSYIDTAIAIEKNMGFKLNSKEVSVFEYYSYVKNLEKSVNG